MGAADKSPSTLTKAVQQGLFNMDYTPAARRIILNRYLETRQKMITTPQSGSKKVTKPPQFDYTVMILAVLSFVLIIGVLFESRWYFRNLYTGPVNTTLFEIGNLPAGGVKRNWVRFKCIEILDSGFHTVIMQSWGDSKIEKEIKVVSNLKVIPVGDRFLAANIPVNHSGSVIVGALHPLPGDARNVLMQDITKEKFDKLFLPYILETNAYKAKSAVFWILLAILSLAICVMVFVSQIKRYRKHIKLLRQGLS